VKYLKSLHSLGVIAAVFAAMTPRASADLGLDVSPAKYEMQVVAGKPSTVPITIRNTGGAPVHIVVSLNDYEIGTSGAVKFMAAGKSKYSLSRSMTVAPREFDLAPNSFQMVRVTAAVPPGAIGEFQAAVFFQTRPTRRPGGVAFSERIGSKVFAIVTDSMKMGGEIEDIQAKPYLDGQRYLIGFKNTSNLHVYANGTVEIRQGSTVVERIAMPAQMPVDRSGARVIEVLGKKLQPGSYTLVAKVDYGGPETTEGQIHFVVR
jgi:hypothetical protein